MQNHRDWNKVPDITNPVTKTALNVKATEVENKISIINVLAVKAALITKFTEIKKRKSATQLIV